MDETDIALPVVGELLHNQSNRSDLATALQRMDVGELRLTGHDRLLYATDASLYEVLPLGVVIPNSVAEIVTLLEFCQRQRIAVLPRGGGTSLAGQCTNRALVVDLSPHFRALREINKDQRMCLAEAGMTIDQINGELADTGLFFAPDPATSAQASLGGCIGNNAAGARSIRYGRTSENLAGVEVVLAGGQHLWLYAGAGRRDPVAHKLAQQVAAIVGEYAELIRARFPRLVRRNAGYSMDLILRQMDAGITPEDLDLTGLLCGSEGTLAIITAARLKLQQIPAARGLAILAFPSLEQALNQLLPILETQPSAVELLDNVVLQTAQGNSEARRQLEVLPLLNGQLPAAVLYVEYQAQKDPSELNDCFSHPALAAPASRIFRQPAEMNQAWMLRKSAEALLHALAGTRKPITFVEDNAIPVQRLGEFIRRFKQIVEAHGTTAAFYAHASVGVLHVRPLLDLHAPADQQAMREIALETAHLARDCGGVMSGEHGDGRVRGPLLPEYFGPEIMQAFSKIKNIFDPAGILNPGMIVNPGSIETITANLREQALRKAAAGIEIETYYNYSDQDSFRGAVERCNGSGFCRKISIGTMCPSYRATLDERHSPRGRANALRHSIFGTSDRPNWTDTDTLETLDLCLSCKSCKNECPSNVDIARLKAEYLAQRYKQTGGPPLAARVFGHVNTLNRLSSLVPGLANRIQNFPPVRSMMNHLLGLAPQRSLPSYSIALEKLFRTQLAAQNPAGQQKVVLFADCFTAFNDSHIGVAATRVFQRLGYRVELVGNGCCGRAMISNGLLDQAKTTIQKTLKLLAPAIVDRNVAAIVVCEPSCLSAMLDDWQQFNGVGPQDLLKELARKAMSPTAFVQRRWKDHPIPPSPRSQPDVPVLFHGHCHAKALWGMADDAALLKRLAGGNAQVLNTGCCGMAGGFGYMRDHYDLSLKIFSQKEFDPIRQARGQAVILTAGTSCRHQIQHAAGKKVVHPIEWLAELL
ncbi:MAG: FAD-binding and (Fe-S)-binding domain-containing protein [Phycisphaerae bacterium]